MDMREEGEGRGEPETISMVCGNVHGQPATTARLGYRYRYRTVPTSIFPTFWSVCMAHLQAVVAGETVEVPDQQGWLETSARWC